MRINLLLGWPTECKAFSEALEKRLLRYCEICSTIDNEYGLAIGIGIDYDCGVGDCRNNCEFKARYLEGHRKIEEQTKIVEVGQLNVERAVTVVCNTVSVVTCLGSCSTSSCTV